MPGPLLDLTVQQPAAPNAIQTIGALANIRDLRSQTQLRAAQTAAALANQQDIQAQADQRNRDIADQNTIQEQMKDPEFARSVASWDGTSAFPLDGVVSPKASSAAQAFVLAQQKERAMLTPLQRTENDAKHKAIGDTVNGLALDETGKKRSDADIAALAPGAFAQLVRDGQLKPENVPTVRSWDDLNKFAVYNRYVQGLGDAASALQVAAGKPGLQTSETGKNDAAAASDNASANKTNTLLPGEVTAQQTKNEQDRRVLAGTSPTGITEDQAEQNKAEKGKLAVSQAEQVIRQKTFDATYGANANQSTIGLTPAAAEQARANFVKSGEKLAQAQGAADAMQSVLDLAAKGNKAANSNLPLVGVETLNALNGIKRINGAEIAQYGHAGSLLDKIQGRIGSLAVGKPIPQDVLDDIRELHTTIAQQAQSTHTREVQVVNTAAGSKFQPMQFGGGSAPAPKAGDTRVINGISYKRDEKGMWNPQ